MAQKQKLDLEEKVKLIKSYQSGKQGLRRSADLAGVAYETFRRWVRRYEAEGADAFKVHMAASDHPNSELLQAQNCAGRWILSPDVRNSWSHIWTKRDKKYSRRCLPPNRR